MVCLIGFRINIPLDICLNIYATEYLVTIQDYLSRRGIIHNDIDYVIGYHPQSGTTPHIHIHLKCNTSPNTKTSMSAMGQDFKNYLKSPDTSFQIFYDEEHKEKMWGGNRRYSAKVTETDDMEGIERFLQYPLKEGIHIMSNLETSYVTKLTSNAQAEYKAKLVWEKKQAEKKALENSRCQTLWEHLDKKNYVSIIDLCEDALSFYRNNPEAPHPKTTLATAEKYAYHKGIWSSEDIILRYYPQLKKEYENKNYLKTIVSNNNNAP